MGCAVWVVGVVSDETLMVPRALLQCVFDAAINSMDFGSGFLDDEEVAALRELAVILGVDPMEATPRQFACQGSGGTP